ncbi:protein phosphatase 2C, putative [Bodo saltans]|uniref:Protein phosphatase 2C, putative n=1 Tax=Bodo saltans TaxID=75058 RepID=A0A0S4KIS4_BODSA|nr:protein phosphatase 2C, putative [Bodo saltans]|eukprot:CUI14281.1 protein phosphatase 2C, putative [Bodo saltans]
MSDSTPSPNVTKARARTYTTVGAPPTAHHLAKTGASPVPSTPQQAERVKSKKIGIYPEPAPATRPCTCDKKYLRTKFCLPGGPQMNFHDRYFACSVCGLRPCMKLCCKCWKGFCDSHATEHFKSSPEHHVMANYELWQYEECFWCFKCNGYTMCEAFDAVLEPLFVSKGSFVNVPVTEKHTEYFEDHGIRCGAGTMQGWRADNEDAHVVYLGLPLSGVDYIAVYDGHGGPLVARYAGKKTHELFDNLCRQGGDMAQILVKTFLLLDETLGRETTADESGSTGCTANAVVINHTTKKIYCANAGDARSVLCRNGQAINLSEDHRPSLESERSRIVAAGSCVSEDDRVEGLLAVSRAFGDFDFKQASSLPAHKQAVTSYPDVSVNALTPEDQFILTACDGIWDCMTSQEVVNFVIGELRSTSDPQKICGKLLDKCVAKEIPEDGIGTDNMSVVLTMLK